MPEEEVGVRPLDGGHQIFVGNRSLDITDSQLLILSRLIPTHLRRVVSDRLPRAKGDLSPIAPIPVTDIRLNEDALGTQVHLTIDDVAGGSFDYALSPARARRLAERLAARAEQIEASAKDQQSH
jgi:hypothetical protein